MGVKRDVVAYMLGVVALALAGFFSPWWWLGFVPLGAGLVWAYYDVIDVEEEDADTSSAPRPF